MAEGSGIVLETVKVVLDGDTVRLTKALQGAQAAMQQAGQRMATIGTGMSLAITLPGIAAGTLAARSAADMERVNRAFDATFGDSTDRANLFAHALAGNLKLAVSDVKNTMLEFDRVLSTMNFKPEVAMQAAEVLTAIAQDLSSRYGRSVEEITEVIQRGMAGATRGLRSVGIYTNMVALNQIALQMGFRRVGEQMNLETTSASVLVTILRQMAKVQGDAAKNIDAPLNKLRQLTAAIKEMRENIGVALGPAIAFIVTVLTDLARFVSSVAKAFQALPAPVQAFTFVLIGAAMAIGPLLLGMAGVMKMLTLTMGAFELAAGGAMAFVGAIAAIVVGGAYLVTHWYEFQRGLLAIWTETKDAFFSFLQSITPTQEMAQRMAQLPGPIGAAGRALASLRGTIDAMKEQSLAGASERFQELDAIISDAEATALGSIPGFENLSNSMRNLMEALRGQHLGDSRSEFEAAQKELQQGLRGVAAEAQTFGRAFDEPTAEVEVLHSAIQKFLRLGTDFDTQVGENKETLASYIIRYDELTHSVEMAKTNQEAWNAEMDAGIAARNAVLGDTAAYGAELTRLTSLLRIGAISQEMFDHAISHARIALEEQTRSLRPIVLRAGVDAGRSLIEGFIMGTSNMLQTLRGFLAKVVSDYIIKGVEFKLGISSPSKVAAGWGMNTVAGFIQGIQGGVGDLASTMSQMVGVSAGPMPSMAFAGGAASLGEGAGGMGGHMTVNNSIHVHANDAQSFLDRIHEVMPHIQKGVAQGMRRSTSFSRAVRGSGNS